MKTHALGWPGPSFLRHLFLLPLLVAAPLVSAIEAVNIVDATLSAKAQGAKPTVRISNTENIAIQFSLATLPNGAHIEKATLRVWVSKVTVPRGRTGGSIEVFSTSDSVTPLNEKTITAATSPATTNSLGSIGVEKTQKGGYVFLDVTSYVRPLTADTSTAFPIFILKQATENDGTSFTFDSKESPGTSHGPVLELATGPMFAVVATDGTLARSSPGVTANRITTGNYEVIFPRDVTTDAFLAAASGSSGDSPFGIPSATRRANNANGVFVLMRNTSGAGQDTAFHLIVTGP